MKRRRLLGCKCPSKKEEGVSCRHFGLLILEGEDPQEKRSPKFTTRTEMRDLIIASIIPTS